MKLFAMSKTIFLPVVLCAVSVAPLVVRAQDDGTNGPPNILLVQREYTKPGKGGAEHERSEGTFAQAMAGHKIPAHYFAMTSMSGPDRALFFSGFDSFADLEAANKSMGKDPAVAATLDRLNVADGDLLSETDSSVWRRRPDMSLNTGNLVGMRYMEIEQFKIKPGRGAEWEEVVKMVMDGYKKGVPEASWVMFEQVFGTAGNAYVVLVPLKSLADVDAHHAAGKGFADAMGKDGMKKLDELEASCVEEEQTNLFHFSPAMSYVPESWVKAEPDYWKPKTVAPAKKAEAKPVQ
jgi:hypothetical protein